MRYFLEISYNGTPFHGWQIQPNAPSVQGIIEDALSTILGIKTAITGAGRTDTGVHARQIFAHFETIDKIKDYTRFLCSLNSLVGKNIAIKKIIEVEEAAHARFDAVERTYKYFITYTKSPFQKEFCWFSPTLLNLDLMNRASSLLIDTNDFTSFAKLHSDSKTNICDVRRAFWGNISDDREALDFIGNLENGIVFTITADRFLRNMVRSIVGTLVDVGRNKISIEKFQDIINRKNRCSAGISMPANGLFLWKVKYTFL